MQQPAGGVRFTIAKRLHNINTWMSGTVFPEAVQCGSSKIEKMMRMQNKFRASKTSAERNPIYPCNLCKDERMAFANGSNKYQILPCIIEGH